MIYMDEIELEFDGKTVTYSEYKRITRKFIEKRVRTLEGLQELWIDDNERRKFIDMLQEMQIDINFIKEVENAEKSDTFDFIANMVFEEPLLTRNERAEQYINENINEISQNDYEIKEIIWSVLEKYTNGGIENINIRILLSEDMIQNNSYKILKSKLGPENIVKLFNDIKTGLYKTKIS